MEENQMPKKRNYERYLERQDMTPASEFPYNVPTESSDAWTQDPFSAQETAAPESTYFNSTYEQPSYEQSSYTSSYPQPVTPQRYDGLEEPVTKGEWALCYLLIMIPCVGIIMMFVWAFSKTEKKSKSNFFKVQLIFMGIIFVLYFLLIMFAMVMGFAMNF